MNRSQLFAIVAAIMIFVGCFLPWMRIDDPALTISGIDTTGTNYGKPAYPHFVLIVLFLAGSFINKLWAKRLTILIAALNLAWAFRNFGIIPRCEAGICPERLLGVYLILIGSILVLLTALFPKPPKIITKSLPKKN